MIVEALMTALMNSFSGTLQTIDSQDEDVRRRLAAYTETNAEYWSFKGNAVREYTHAYLQYPAMMVPKMQGEIIKAIKGVVPVSSIFDPFMGSGTVMTEAMLQGLGFVGNDINPLSVLICRTKSGPFLDETIKLKSNEVLDRISNDANDTVEVNFTGIDKWFQKDVVTSLSKIRRAIILEPELWCRMFMWVALAETVRLTSNSRTSTFKLHIRPEDEIAKRKLDPISVFNDTITANIARLRAMKEQLEEKSLLVDGHYTGKIDIRRRDSADLATSPISQCDLLVTSPPYGDNVTTVPYGQFSFLPLQWIPISDIGADVDDSLLANTHAIDTRSLGGSHKDVDRYIPHLCESSSTFAKLMDDLKQEPRSYKTKVAAFCRDLERSIDPILEQLAENAYMIWIVGNRRVAKRQIATDTILRELLEAKGSHFVEILQRKIPSKRMAIKNSIAATMRSESILIMRKGC